MNYKEFMKNNLPIKNGYSITGTYTSGGDLEGFHYKTSRNMHALNISDFFEFLEKEGIDKNLLLTIDFNRVKYKEDKTNKEKWYERVDRFARFHVGEIKPFNEVGDFQYFCEVCNILKAKTENSQVVSSAGAYGTETIYPLSVFNKKVSNFVIPLEQLENLEVLSPADNVNQIKNSSGYIYFANSGADKLMAENPDIVDVIAGLE